MLAATKGSEKLTNTLSPELAHVGHGIAWQLPLPHVAAQSRYAKSGAMGTTVSSCAHRAMAAATTVCTKVASAGVIDASTLRSVPPNELT